MCVCVLLPDMMSSVCVDTRSEPALGAVWLSSPQRPAASGPHPFPPSFPPLNRTQTGEQPRIRALFERATHLPLPPKKMKFLFRRYLEYEKEEGDDASVEHVKRRAMEFVENSLKA